MNGKILGMLIVVLFTGTPGSAWAADEHGHDHGKETKEEGTAAEGHGDEHGDGHGEEGAIRLNAEQRRANGVEIQKIAARGLGEEVTAPGEVQVNAYASAKVTPRIAAHIVQRHARLGDVVKEGALLATLSSAELADAQGQLILAEREWQRVQALGKDVASDRRFVEARVARQLAFARVLAFGMSKAQVESFLREDDPARADGTFALLAPRAGRVIQDDFIEGELAEPGKVLFEITDESVLWVQVRLSAAQAGGVRVGTPVRVRAGEGWLTGRVIQSAHRMDEETRTIPVRAEIANTGDVLHPGQFVDVRVQSGGGRAALAVPADAVVLMQGASTVFKLAGDELKPQPVETGATKGGWTEIRAGIANGDEIVVKGVFYLKSLLLKSQLGEGHAH